MRFFNSGDFMLVILLITLGIAGALLCCAARGSGNEQAHRN
jgi:hypothetical protein